MKSASRRERKGAAGAGGGVEVTTEEVIGGAVCPRATGSRGCQASGVAQDPQVPSAPDLDRTGGGFMPQLVRAFGRGRRPGPPGLAHGVGQREEVVGRGRRRRILTAEPDDLPPARSGEPFG